MLGRVLRLLPDPGVMLHRRARDADLEVIKEQQAWAGFQIGLAVQPPEDAGKPFNQTSVVIALCWHFLCIMYIYLSKETAQKEEDEKLLRRWNWFWFGQLMVDNGKRCTVEWNIWCASWDTSIGHWAEQSPEETWNEMCCRVFLHFSSAGRSI